MCLAKFLIWGIFSVTGRDLCVWNGRTWVRLSPVLFRIPEKSPDVCF